MMAVNNGTVAICMATYNGEKYISEQIESILFQTYKNWVLFIRDDNSIDATLKVIETFERKYPHKIFVIREKKLKGGSAKENFASILKFVTENYDFSYFMFSDQDDVWLCNKIELTLNKMLAVERSYKGPVLVHTDLMVVDSHLNILGKSFFKYRALNPKIKQLNRLLVQNNITGCTMLWNKELNKIVNLKNEGIAMHDWWMALVACCFGYIDFLPNQTILYRQHENNVVGATNVNSIRFIIKRMIRVNHIKSTFDIAFKQAECFYNFYKDFGVYSEGQIRLLVTFFNMKNFSKIKKIICIFKNQYFKQGIIQILGELFFM